MRPSGSQRLCMLHFCLLDSICGSIEEKGCKSYIGAELALPSTVVAVQGPSFLISCAAPFRGALFGKTSISSKYFNLLCHRQWYWDGFLIHELIRDEVSEAMLGIKK